MKKINIKIPPTKISTFEELTEREKNKAWIPGGQISKLKDNPMAQSHYKKLIEAGIEDAADFPDIDMSKARKKKPTKSKGKRKSKKKSCGCK